MDRGNPRIRKPRGAEKQSRLAVCQWITDPKLVITNTEQARQQVFRAFGLHQLSTVQMPLAVAPQTKRAVLPSENCIVPEPLCPPSRTPCPIPERPSVQRKAMLIVSPARAGSNVPEQVARPSEKLKVFPVTSPWRASPCITPPPVESTASGQLAAHPTKGRTLNSSSKRRTSDPGVLGNL